MDLRFTLSFYCRSPIVGLVGIGRYDISEPFQFTQYDSPGVDFMAGTKMEGLILARCV
jgi:hypothetical protein